MNGKAQAALLFSLALLGCGGTADPAGGQAGGGSVGGPLPVSAGPKAEQAGSRLRKVWHSANDSSVTPAGYFDTALKTRCSFERVAGAVELCVPEDVYTLTHAQWNSLYSTSNRTLFSDSSCKNSNVAALNDDDCTRYGVVRVLPDADSRYAPACGGQTTPAWYIVTPVSPGTQLYYYGVPAGGGQCCSCQPLKETSSSVALMKMEPLTATNADRTPLVRAELSVDP